MQQFALAKLNVTEGKQQILLKFSEVFSNYPS